MAVTAEASVETGVVIENYKAYASAMFAEGSPYQLAKTDIKDLFHEFGLVNAEHGQVLAQTLAQLATSANSEALKAGQSTLTLSKDVALKQAQAELVIRQTRGYDDNLLVKVTEFQSGVTQFAVNAGGDNIQASVDNLNVKINQVETRVDNGTYIPDALPDEILVAPTVNLSTSITSVSFRVNWNTVVGATSYVCYIDGIDVSSAGQNETFVDFTGATPDTKYAINVVAYSNTTKGKLSNTIITTTLA